MHKHDCLHVSSCHAVQIKSYITACNITNHTCSKHGMQVQYLRYISPNTQTPFYKKFLFYTCINGHCKLGDLMFTGEPIRFEDETIHVPRTQGNHRSVCFKTCWQTVLISKPKYVISFLRPIPKVLEVCYRKWLYQNLAAIMHSRTVCSNFGNCRSKSEVQSTLSISRKALT